MNLWEIAASLTQPIGHLGNGPSPLKYDIIYIYIYIYIYIDKYDILYQFVILKKIIIIKVRRLTYKKRKEKVYLFYWPIAYLFFRSYNVKF